MALLQHPVSAQAVSLTLQGAHAMLFNTTFPAAGLRPAGACHLHRPVAHPRPPGEQLQHIHLPAVSASPSDRCRGKSKEEMHLAPDTAFSEKNEVIYVENEPKRRREVIFRRKRPTQLRSPTTRLA